MNNKCEWKDGKFKPCDDIDKYIYWDNAAYIYISGIKVNYCPFCGADIRKPPEAESAK